MDDDQNDGPAYLVGGTDTGHTPASAADGAADHAPEPEATLRTKAGSDLKAESDRLMAARRADRFLKYGRY